MSEISYPNESPEYRSARDELLKAELDLREHVERVAQQRRDLPPGGLVREDYVFDEQLDGKVAETRLSDLFGEGKNTVFLYSFMYAPDMDSACPMCTAMLDGLNGQIVHLDQRISVALAAKHSVERISEHARNRGWSNFRLLSSARNSYNSDYFGEIDGKQIPNANVFVREDGEIRHFWGAEMVMGPMIKGGNMRHMDLIWPLWNVLDMTPGGRGEWYPKLSYTDSSGV